MNQSFLLEDAVASVQKIEDTFAVLGISPCYAYQTLNQFGSFLNSHIGHFNEEQNSFISTYLSRKVGPMSKISFRHEVEAANFFLPNDAYIALSVAIANIVDYIISLSPDYSEDLAKYLVREAKNIFLAHMQRENKGLALVYTTNR